MYNHFNFKKLEDKILITNDSGAHEFLSTEEFNTFITSPDLLEDSLKYSLVENGFFIPDAISDISEIVTNRMRAAKAHIFHPTSLFIIVVNENCNCDCIYCQASSQMSNRRIRREMKSSIIFQILDFILASGIRDITIEFQGGEPLISFEVIRDGILYLKEKASSRINLNCSVVTNLSLLTEEMAKFFKTHGVSISFSLDGSREVHEYNRRIGHPNRSFDAVENGIAILDRYGIQFGAIQTTSRFSLMHAKDIVDEYVAHGLNEIFLRPLTRLGAASSQWNLIGYSADEFIAFYQEAMGYIVQLNLKGTEIRETTAVILLSKMTGHCDVDYMDLRSPCGACIGQMAFDPDGNIYSCDEGRMLSYMGDDSFRIGNVSSDTYESVINSKLCQQICSASVMESNSICSSCVYLPFCGICPVYNLSVYGDMTTFSRQDYRCTIYKGIMDYLFKCIMADNEENEVFRKWVED